MNMDKALILKTMTPAVEQRGCFVVDITVSKDNDIVFAIEKEVGDVDLEDCVAINDAFLAAFDKDAEDYSLTVTSAGLDQPFKVLRQYEKALGSLVEVRLKGGKKLTGVLAGVTEEGISLHYSQKEAVEGSKKKVLVEHEDGFAFADINSVVPHVVFKD